MSDYIYQQAGIYDRTPGGVLRHVRSYLGKAVIEFNEFNFKEAKRQVELAVKLTEALHIELGL